jgi:hypothetical protein
MQTGVDKIVFGMKAAPDGGANLRDAVIQSGQNAPEIVGGVLENESLELMKKFAHRFPDSPAIPYVKAMIKPYL